MSEDRMFIIFQLRKLFCLLCVNKIKKTLKHFDVVCPCLRVTPCPPNWLLISVFSSSTFGSLSDVTKQTGCSILQFLHLFNNSGTICISVSPFILEILSFLDTSHHLPTSPTKEHIPSFVEDLFLYFGCWILNLIAILSQ